MKPDSKLITIRDNKAQLIKLLQELVLLPRVNAIKWSAMTKQTPNIKIGYPGQHIASLITGMPGERTGARGNDLVDGSEVKSCSRIDQLDVCKECGSSVARSETVCSNCESTNILRKDDSKWLFTIRSENDLKVLTEEVNRVVLLLGDYPNFEKGDYTTLRFQAFEIWTHSPRSTRFVELMTNYYNKIFLAHREKNASKTPAPKNFWPYSYQFYMCNPILVFSCTVTDANTEPKITIDHYVEPEEDRTPLESMKMPVALLTDPEVDLLIAKGNPEELAKCTNGTKDLASLGARERRAAFTYVNENLRTLLPLRDTDRIAVAKKAYVRRKLAE